MFEESIMNNKTRIEKLDRQFRSVTKISKTLNNICIELAVLIRQTSKDEIENNKKRKYD